MTTLENINPTIGLNAEVHNSQNADILNNVTMLHEKSEPPIDEKTLSKLSNLSNDPQALEPQDLAARQLDKTLSNDCLMLSNPSIKNEQSYRVIKLDSMDYKFLMLYVEKIRNFNNSDILFTSLKPPYSPLSYSSINAIFKTIEQAFRASHPVYFDDTNIDSIQKLTPHVCRYTWAYTTLAFAIKKYRNERIQSLKINNEIMQKAQENLRVLGGWSANSIMPSYYAKRFIVDSANLINLHSFLFL